MKQKHLQSEGVVMDPQSQHFDAVLPKAHNNQIPCEVLGFNQILSVHGSKRKDKTGRSMQVVLPHYESIQQLRVLYPQLMRDLKGVEVCAKADAQNNHGLFYLRNNKPLTSAIVQGLSLAQEIGMIKKLTIHQNQFGFEPVYTDNPIAYIRNTWMEDWVAAVLAKHDDGYWNGGFSGIEVSIKQYEDYQEFDFLGARKNHLVYWSCKNTKEVKPEQLFEIDALRDEVGGRDFHIAGLVHTATVKSGMRMKTKRLGLQLVNVLDNDAEDKLVEISCR